MSLETEFKETREQLARVTAERNKWEADALRYCNNAEDHRARVAKLEKELSGSEIAKAHYFSRTLAEEQRNAELEKDKEELVTCLKWIVQDGLPYTEHEEIEMEIGRVLAVIMHRAKQKGTHAG